MKKYKMLCPTALWERDYSEGMNLGILRIGDVVELLHLTPHTNSAFVEASLQGKPVRGYVMREALDLLSPQPAPPAQNVFPSPFLRIANAVAHHGKVRVRAKSPSFCQDQTALIGGYEYLPSRDGAFMAIGRTFAVTKVDVRAGMVYNADKDRWHRGGDLELLRQPLRADGGDIDKYGDLDGVRREYYVDTDSIQDEKTVVSGKFQAPAIDTVLAGGAAMGTAVHEKFRAVTAQGKPYQAPATGTVHLKAGEEIFIHRMVMVGPKENLDQNPLAVIAGIESHNPCDSPSCTCPAKGYSEKLEFEKATLSTRNSELSDKLGSLQTEHNQLLRDYALLQRENESLKRKLGKVGSR